MSGSIFKSMKKTNNFDKIACVLTLESDRKSVTQYSKVETNVTNERFLRFPQKTIFFMFCEKQKTKRFQSDLQCLFLLSVLGVWFPTID